MIGRSAHDVGDYPPIEDGKAADALRTIGEVAAALALRTHVLRYWEEQFPMLKPVKLSGGRRYYRPEDVANLRTISRLLYRDGYTIKGARRYLEDATASIAKSAPTAKPTPTARPSLTTGPDVDMLTSLRSIRNRLAAALG